jgi:nucleotide-binding universal stress UspA family protein
MIVMGTTGASGMKKALVGSNAASVIKRSKCPVLAVPQQCSFKGIEKIVFAADFHETKDDRALAPLLELALLFGSEVVVLNIRKELKEIPSQEEAYEGLRIESAFKPLSHSYHFMENEDAAKGIKEFTQQSGADVLAMIPRRHSFFEDLFGTSTTEELALHAQVPLLALPENDS